MGVTPCAGRDPSSGQCPYQPGRQPRDKGFGAGQHATPVDVDVFSPQQGLAGPCSATAHHHAQRAGLGQATQTTTVAGPPEPGVFRCLRVDHHRALACKVRWRGHEVSGLQGSCAAPAGLVRKLRGWRGSNVVVRKRDGLGRCYSAGLKNTGPSRPLAERDDSKAGRDPPTGEAGAAEGF